MNDTVSKQRGSSDLAHDLVQHISDRMRLQIELWQSSSPRFDCFCEDNHSKIVAKFQNAKCPEDKRDVHAELEVAYRLLGVSAFDVVYEEEKKGPDFSVSSQFGNFYAEVKRIRETAAAAKFNECVNRITTEIRNLNSSVNVSVVFRLNDGSRENKEDYDKYAEALSGAIIPLIDECVEVVRRYEKELRVGETTNLRSAVFPDLEVELNRDDKPGPGSVLPVYPLFFTQKESLKYCDIILSSLKQLQDGSQNVLIVVSHSYTRTPDQLDIGVKRIWQQVRDGNESFFQSKRFEGLDNFTKRLSLLSAVIVTGTLARTQNLVWSNPNAPALDANLLDLLRRI